MNPTASFLIFRLPALMYMGLIFFLSSHSTPPKVFEGVPDYFLHSTGYTLLYVLVYWAHHEGFVTLDGRGGYWLPAVITVLYGISDEYHQRFVPGRVASLTDVVSDATGAGLGVLIVMALSRLATRARARSWT